MAPTEKLTEDQVKTGMNKVIAEGLTAEAVTTLTSGAFLVAMALKLGASNFQIGILASLPTISNIFQIVAIYFLQKYRNRRIISAVSAFLARIPFILIAALPFLFSPGTSLVMLIALLFVHFFFNTVTNLSWNSWMKDLIPEAKLGSYFSTRNRLIQILNVTLSVAVAFILDFVKDEYPKHEMLTYAFMFCAASFIGFLGVYFFAKTPEPKMQISEPVNIFSFYKKPLKDINFRNFLVFNSTWAFATNLAIPFFSVYLMSVLNMKLSYIIGLNTISQISSILLIKHWGKYADRYSNKTILSFCAPLYILAMLIWPFTTMPSSHFLTIPILVFIYTLMGLSSAGINLALANIGYKLTPKEETVTYLSTRTMITAFFTAAAPITGGLFADFFSDRQLSWVIKMKSAAGETLVPFINLESWDFFFVIGAIIAFFSLKRLSVVKEDGEVQKKIMVSHLKKGFKTGVKVNAGAFAGMVAKTMDSKKKILKKAISEEYPSLDTTDKRYSSGTSEKGSVMLPAG
jgi:MFS family permease